MEDRRMTEDRTLRPAEGGDVTARPDVTPQGGEAQGGEVSTLRPSATAPLDGVGNHQEDGFLLDDTFYKKIKCLSDHSGEAQVFLVEHDGKQFVLKVYYPNFNVNKRLMLVVRHFDFEMVVRLYGFGMTYVDGKHRFYELMEYLRGGSLADYKLGGDVGRFRRIALQAAAALAYCHNYNILHKDVKPSNFFFRDEDHRELVLGDFGISNILENDGKKHRTTQARTPVYAAPEMYSDVIDGVVEVTAAADFYSLGITLMAVWLGENPLSANERVMMRQKSEGRLPRINELPDTVKTIVQGLTAVNPLSRWGYEEVERWFKGEEVPVDMSSPFLRYKSFVVDPDRNVVAGNVHELVPLLLEHEKLAVGYLYSGRISQWLEACGNMKLSTIVKDIVVNRYPVDQHAGLMAAVYAMEPTFPYKDITGAACDDVHAIALSLLANAKKYGVLLQNPNDALFLYLEAHTNVDVNRLRSYFVTTLADGTTVRCDSRVALFRTVFEIDPDVPFLREHPSSTLRQIVHAFGYEELTEDDWHSLCDGRLLSWMKNHADEMARESLRILTHGQVYSDALAYKVLYNLDRETAYDLREADTPEKIGKLLRSQLVQAQHLSDEAFAAQMNDFVMPGGRFAYFAQLHGWMALLEQAERTFDMQSEENRERLGAYDLKTALYRFCRMLGVVPVYELPDGTQLTDGRHLPADKREQIRQEIRQGSFMQWMAAFYHEDPTRDLSEAYAYERELEQWIMAVGGIDASQNYYKRFIDARNETEQKMSGVRRGWNRAKLKENSWRMVFYSLCGVWALLVLIFGVTGRDYLLRHTFVAIGLPLGGMTAVIVATRAFFRGYGFLLSLLWGALGALSALVPILVLKYVDAHIPEMFNIAIVVMTAAYMLVCHLTDFRGDQKADNKIINEVLSDDIQSSLIEPLYYTFKTKSYRFKGSKFGMLDDMSDQVRSISGESVLHYVLWSVMVAVLVAEFVVFSPKLMNVRNPNLDSEWKPKSQNIIKQLDAIDTSPAENK